MSSDYVIRRVRLDLPADIPSPFKEQFEALSYAQWLHNHVGEVSSLLSKDNEPLLAGVRSRTGVSVSTGKTVFVTDFCFVNKEHFDYYNATYLPAMRNRITESYPGAFLPDSPFKYSFGIKGEGDVGAYDSLGVIDTANDCESKTIAATGISCF